MRRYVKRHILLIVFVLIMNVVSSVLVYNSVVYFQKFVYAYGPVHSPINDDVNYRKPEDDWAKPGYLDP